MYVPKIASSDNFVEKKDMPTYTKIKTRRGTLAQWNSSNPIPADGEPCWVSDIGRFKVGDGTRHFSQLPYVTLPDATSNASGLMTGAQFNKLAGITKTTEQTDGLIAESAGIVFGDCVRIMLADDGLQTVYAGDVRNIWAMAHNGKLITPVQELSASGGDVIDFIFINSDKMPYSVPDAAFKGVNAKCAMLPDYITAIGRTAFDNFKCERLFAFGLTPPALDSTPSGSVIQRTYVHKIVESEYNSSLWASFTTISLL